MTERIIRNAIRCNHCREEVVSEFRHDFAMHSCDKLGDNYIAADGGRDYRRRVGNPADYTDVSTVEQIPE